MINEKYQGCPTREHHPWPEHGITEWKFCPGILQQPKHMRILEMTSDNTRAVPSSEVTITDGHVLDL